MAADRLFGETPVLRDVYVYNQISSLPSVSRSFYWWEAGGV